MCILNGFHLSFFTFLFFEAYKYIKSGISNSNSPGMRNNYLQSLSK